MYKGWTIKLVAKGKDPQNDEKLVLTFEFEKNGKVEVYTENMSVFEQSIVHNKIDQFEAPAEDVKRHVDQKAYVDTFLATVPLGDFDVTAYAVQATEIGSKP